MRLLNLGCGKVYHTEWINIDLSSDNENIIPHNILKGIPFLDNNIDVVYHSHLLEHLTKIDAEGFLKECFRVLRPQGIIRIAVPDLETIAREYLRNLDRAINKEPFAEYDYEWILLEMFDQTTRNSGGGEMAKYLQNKEIPNKEYVFSRIGNEGKKIYDDYLSSMKEAVGKEARSFAVPARYFIRKLKRVPGFILKKTFFRIEYESIKNEIRAFEIGRFRLSGEIHQNMFDRYSLSKLLLKTGFKNVGTVSAFESSIKEWDRYQLDSINGVVRKPDSLFIEAIK
jgi:predicted SAM-dependent methyltransferase